MKEQQLNELSIFALRELARRTGVNSPTSKRKNELIEEIIAIQEGRQQPVISSTRQGRPPKGFVLNIDQIMENEKKSIILKQEGYSDYIGEDCILGYVEKLNNNVGFLWVKNVNTFVNYFMPVNAFNGNVLSGDFVSAEMLKSNDGTIVKKVITIEGRPLVDFETRNNYNDIEHHLPKNRMMFGNLQYTIPNIKFGENLYIYGKDNNNNSKCLVDLLNACNADCKLYVNLAMVEKNKIYLKDIKDAEVFTTTMFDDLDYAKRIINIVVERAKRLMEQGNNVVIAIDDLLTIASLEKEDIVMLKQLMSLTKCAGKGSISIFAIMAENTSLNMLEKLADKKYYLSDKELKEM